MWTRLFDPSKPLGRSRRWPMAPGWKIRDEEMDSEEFFDDDEEEPDDFDEEFEEFDDYDDEDDAFDLDDDEEEEL